MDIAIEISVILYVWNHVSKLIFDILFEKIDLFTLKCPENHYKLYNLVVLRLWDYAQTILRSEQLHISYPKPEIGTKKVQGNTKIGTKKSIDLGKILNICMHYICMYYGYVL